ncbi:MAG: KPN_02809 family neutral zinc metallopeptidase [Advenella sp.]|uniref:KPN_02809 family neutral zinc metallopeptidase n=1 Tax=Advenella sp. TaxID=1872388 RepID=UPI003F9EAE1E
MRLDDQEQSSNVEDRRGSGGSGRGRGMRLGGGKIGIGTIVVALAAWYFLGINPMTILGGDDIQQEPAGQSQQAGGPVADDQDKVFMSKVLKTTETVWSGIFKQNGGTYQNPALVLYSGATRSACGVGQAAMGPFYCPEDRKVYMDMSFFHQMGAQMGVQGDFAQGYVLAHEVGHHVQNLLGVMDKMAQARSSMNERQANDLSVRVELQADCFAGIWAHELQKEGTIIEDGDIEEAMNAAAAVGDDHIQKQAQGYVVPDSFTHGSSEQRMSWFKRGLAGGDMKQCNTFAQQ